jgi:hypothetical protein
MHPEANVHNAASHCLNQTNKADTSPPDLYKLLILEMKKFQGLDRGTSNWIRYCCLDSELSEDLQNLLNLPTLSRAIQRRC